jgi:hypothetical protein
MALKNNDLALRDDEIEELEAEELDTADETIEDALESVNGKAARLDLVAHHLYRARLEMIEFNIGFGQRLKLLTKITEADYELYHLHFYKPPLPLAPGNERAMAAKGITKPHLVNERIGLELQLLLLNSRIEIYNTRLEYTRDESENNIIPLAPEGLSGFFTTPRLTFNDFDSLLHSSGIAVKGRIRKSGIGAKVLGVCELLLEKCLLPPRQLASFRDAFTKHYCGTALSRSAYTNAKLNDKGNIQTYQSALFAAFNALKK